MKRTPEDARAAALPEKVSEPALRALAGAGISTLGQLAALSEKEFLKLHGVGPKGVRMLRQSLQEAGLDFATAAQDSQENGVDFARFEKAGTGYTARFDVRTRHSAEEVWAWLTDSERIREWFPELRAGELRPGGSMLFDMGGSFDAMEILAFAQGEILEYAWGEDAVRFELRLDAEGCRLTLIEKLRALTAHTPKDIAGWHECLRVLLAGMDGQPVEDRETEWKALYRRYATAIRKLRNDP